MATINLRELFISELLNTILTEHRQS